MSLQETPAPDVSDVAANMHWLRDRHSGWTALPDPQPVDRSPAGEGRRAIAGRLGVPQRGEVEFRREH